MSIKWPVYRYHRLKWCLFVQLHWTSVLYWCTLNWCVREGWIAPLSVLSVAGKNPSYEFQTAILSIAYTQFCMLTVIASVDLNKQTNKQSNKQTSKNPPHLWNNGTQEGENKPSQTKTQETDKRVETPWSEAQIRTVFHTRPFIRHLLATSPEHPQLCESWAGLTLRNTWDLTRAQRTAVWLQANAFIFVTTRSWEHGNRS